MTPTELASLEALAKAATPGPWKHVETIAFHTGLTYTSVQPVDPDPDKMRPMLMASGEYHLCRMSHTAAQHAIAIHRANAAFIAAANPAAILSLIEENKRMREALDGLLKRYVALVDCGDCGFWDAEAEGEVIAARAALEPTP